MKSLPYIFFGTPDIAAETLQELFVAGYIPQVVITGPDRPVGRGMHMTPPPVKVWADDHGIRVLQPEKIDITFVEMLQREYPDNELYIVVAYGKILPESLIHIPKYGTLNIHYSLLPRFRGASPVESAILAGDLVTGVTIQSMVYELDAGDIIARAETDIDPDETTPQLRSRLSTIGSSLLIETLHELPDHLANKTPQNPEGVTRCGKIKKTDGEVKRNDDSEEMYRKWRAYQPWPGIYYFDENNKRVKITEMKRINGIPKISKIIPEGGKEIVLH